MSHMQFVQGHLRPTATLSGGAVEPANHVATTMPQLLLAGNRRRSRVPIKGINATKIPTSQRELGK